MNDHFLNGLKPWQYFYQNHLII